MINNFRLIKLFALTERQSNLNIQAQYLMKNKNLRNDFHLSTPDINFIIIENIISTSL